MPTTGRDETVGDELDVAAEAGEAEASLATGKSTAGLANELAGQAGNAIGIESAAERGSEREADSETPDAGHVPIPVPVTPEDLSETRDSLGTEDLPITTTATSKEFAWNTPTAPTRSVPKPGRSEVRQAVILALCWSIPLAMLAGGFLSYLLFSR